MDKMKALIGVLLAMLVIGILIGCETSEKKAQQAAAEAPDLESGDTGINDVFQDTEEVTPPVIPKSE